VTGGREPPQTGTDIRTVPRTSTPSGGGGHAGQRQAVWLSDAPDTHRPRSSLRAHMASGPPAMRGLLSIMALQSYLGGELAVRLGAGVRGRDQRLPSEADEDRLGA